LDTTNLALLPTPARPMVYDFSRYYRRDIAYVWFPIRAFPVNWRADTADVRSAIRQSGPGVKRSQMTAQISLGRGEEFGRKRKLTLAERVCLGSEQCVPKGGNPS
jgi:hypothetical protein